VDAPKAQPGWWFKIRKKDSQQEASLAKPEEIWRWSNISP
jgi:hypothetical protein